jgi:hypothetical protein
MDTTTMTNAMDELTIYDEIINCGILDEDSVLNFGSGNESGKFIETYLEYTTITEPGSFIAVDADPTKVDMLKDKFVDDNVLFVETSLQSYIDSEPDKKDWVVITGVFDKHLYGEFQHDYVTSVIENAMSIANKGVIFTLKPNLSDSFMYSTLYFFVTFTNTYGKVTIKKVNDNNYVYCIFKY